MDDVDCAFKAHRINRTLRTQILELSHEHQGTMGMDLCHSRMYKKFDTIAEGIHKQNTCEFDRMTGHTNFFILCDYEWITPIKYEVLKMRA